MFPIEFWFPFQGNTMILEEWDFDKDQDDQFSQITLD